MQCKTYSTEVYCWDKEYCLCISYSNCAEEDECCNPYTNTEEAKAEDEEDARWRILKRKIWTMKG